MMIKRFAINWLRSARRPPRRSGRGRRRGLRGVAAARPGPSRGPDRPRTDAEIGNRGSEGRRPGGVTAPGARPERAGGISVGVARPIAYADTGSPRSLRDVSTIEQRGRHGTDDDPVAMGGRGGGGRAGGGPDPDPGAGAEAGPAEGRGAAEGRGPGRTGRRAARLGQAHRRLDQAAAAGVDPRRPPAARGGTLRDLLPDRAARPHPRRGPGYEPRPADHRRAARPARREDLPPVLRRRACRRADDRSGEGEDRLSPPGLSQGYVAGIGGMG